jgi:endonuclease YncB( thermonuclease family)
LRLTKLPRKSFSTIRKAASLGLVARLYSHHRMNLPSGVLLCVTAMLGPLVAIAQTAPPAQPFQRLDGCVYKSQRWNDGDSFHVILPDQKELIFRLYFVDTPEEERVYADRITEQAAYFKISADAALEVGNEASEFTKRALAKPFTTYTRWRRALGRSAIWRYYAIVITADERDLNELLVSAGLARIYGTRTPLPDGRDSRTYLAHCMWKEVRPEAHAPDQCGSRARQARSTRPTRRASL